MLFVYLRNGIRIVYALLREPRDFQTTSSDADVAGIAKLDIVLELSAVNMLMLYTTA